jgi:serine/threonine-protein kinase
MADQIDRLKSALADRYTIEREIGAGGMATVYLAEDLKHRRQVAIKVLHPELAASIGVKRFVREIEIAANLTHPHILPLFDSGEADGFLYYVMPFVEGESLRDRLLRDKKLSVPDAVRITDQVAAALSYAHERGVIHRDIKPENILCTGNQAVVADFGIARAVEVAGGETLTGTGIAIGTPAYMSPEQAAGDSNIDGRSDVYALGCVVYEMVSGRTPFEGATPRALLAKHAVDTAPSLRTLDPDLPPYVERAVSQALVKDPARRFKTPNDFAATLMSQTVVPRVGKRRLAVLPPINLMNDPGQEYFVQGMHNALISELQRAGVAVIARTSVLQYENTQKPVRQIAGELGVDVLVEPCVFRAADSVELEVRLVDGSTEEYLSDPIVRSGELRNVVAVYRELTGAIAAEIHAALTPQTEAHLASARPVNPEAYEAYLRGQFHCWRLTPTDLDQAFEYFQRALTLDSTYAPAQAGIAWVWFGRGQFGLVPPREAAAHGSAAARQALALDSTLAEVQYAAALVRIWQEWDWEGGEAAFRRAIEINPNYADARLSYTGFLAQMGRTDEARAQIERALELDPFNPMIRSFNGYRLLYERRYAESIDEYEAALRIEPDNPVHFSNLASAYHLNGNYDEALVMVRKLVPGDQELEEALDRGYAEGGYRAAMLKYAETLAARPEAAELLSLTVAMIYAFAGEKERTLEWLEVMYQTRNPNMPAISEPLFGLVFDDPRFQDLRRRMNLPM